MKKLLTLLMLLLSISPQIKSQVTVQGYIHYCNGLPLEGVSVGPVLTDENGFYSFETETGSDYVVAPSYAELPMAGIDFDDLATIASWILGPDYGNPYNIIAADVNQSQGISTVDLLTLSKYIQGLASFPPNVPFWRFIPTDYVFPNPLDPWAEDYPQVVMLNQGQVGATYTINFTAIKIGDVNCSFSTGNAAEINGQFFYDVDENCENIGEEELSNFFIRFNSDNYSVYTNAYANGYFSTFLAPGTYTVDVLLPNDYWTICPDLGSITVEQNDIVEFDIPLQAVELCPYLEVDLATSVLRRCMSNTYVVQYKNTGTVAATDAYITIALDDFLELDNSSILWSTVEGNTYTFPIGEVPIGGSGYFSLNVNVSCEAELGQTHCTEAHIYPDEFCGEPDPLWDGSSLIVSGICEGDSVHFTVLNIGEAMQSPTNYIVIEDDLIMYEGVLNPLNPLESQDIPIEANGSTFRIEFEQAAGHPGQDRPGLSLEGCGTNGNGEISTGFVVIFSENDANGFISIDCRENVDSYDPNDKQAFPGGVGESHQIEANTDIEYLIRFQNTGTAAAINVIVRDTLSPSLDPGSIQLGASSHEVDFRLTEGGILNFYFLGIALPDSNANEPASHGFIKYRIKQQPDLPIGTMIENRAGIYFDFNDPVMTNTAFHTIGEDRLPVFTGVTSVPSSPIRVSVTPNPTKDWLFFDVLDTNVSSGIIEFYSPQGQRLLAHPFEENSFAVNLKSLPSGVYFYRLIMDGTLIHGGKVVVE